MKKKELRNLLKLAVSELIDVCRPGTTAFDYARALKFAEHINRKLNKEEETTDEGMPL